MPKPTVADTFLDQLRKRHASFRPVEESGAEAIRHEMGRVVEKMQRVAREGLEKISEEGKLLTTTFAQERAEAIAREMDDLLARGIADVDATLLSLKEGAYTVGVNDFQIASEFIPGGPAATLNASFTQVYAEAAQAALTNPVLGIKPDALWNGVRAGTDQRVREVMLHAVLSGESVDDTALALSEGLDITKGGAERIARTSLNAIYNDAQRSVIDANADIFVGYRWLAALDDRTSAICIRLHGSYWPLGTIPPGPPAHWRCRSSIEPVFRNPDVQAQMMSETQRVKDYKASGASEEAFIRASTPADNWLKRQPVFVQERVLGSQLKAQMFRDGKATIEDVVSPAMEVLTDKELVRRMAALRPSDNSLQALAVDEGISRVPSKALIAREDRSLINQAWFEQPTAMPNPNHAPGS